MNKPPPLPPTVRPPPIPRAPALTASAISGDALERVLEIMQRQASAMEGLRSSIRAGGANSDVVINALKDMRLEHAKVLKIVEKMEDRVERAETNIRRHDSGFRQTSEVDAKQQSDMAAFVIALDETRKMAKQSFDKVSAFEKSASANLVATKAQTPMITEIVSQTKGVQDIVKPAKVATAVNFVVVVIMFVLEVLKHMK